MTGVSSRVAAPAALLPEVFTETWTGFVGVLLCKSQLTRIQKVLKGLFGEKNNDEKLVNNLLSLMHQNNTDYTNTFCDLMKNKLPNNSFYQHHKFVDWFKEWKNRQSQNKMPKKWIL